jgi:hypothetical protein
MQVVDGQLTAPKANCGLPAAELGAAMAVVAPTIPPLSEVTVAKALPLVMVVTPTTVQVLGPQSIAL